MNTIKVGWLLLESKGTKYIASLFQIMCVLVQCPKTKNDIKSNEIEIKKGE